MVGSVNLALGQKMSREMLRDEEKPALVELIFQVDNPGCVERLKEKEISVEEGQIIISRKLTGNQEYQPINGEVCTAARSGRSLLFFWIYTATRTPVPVVPGSAVKDSGCLRERSNSGEKTDRPGAFSDLESEKKELTSYQLDEETRKREISFLAI